MYDVVIVGAGPAGATLARLIGDKFKVLLLDRRQLADESSSYGFEKSCGGLIAPDAQYMLAKLGLGIPQKVLVGPQLFTVRTIDMQTAIEKYYQRHYINVDRQKFDKWLVSMVPSAVKFVAGSIFKSFEKEDNRIKVNFLHNGKKFSEYTKVLVGADGANSTIRKQAFPGISSPKVYVSIQEWFIQENNLPYFSTIFDQEVSDFYSWTIPKNEYLILGSAIPYGENIQEKFALLKKKLLKLGFIFDNRAKTNGAFILRPLKTKQISIGKGNIALIGEAAGWISPSSAEGMSYAFRSALALAKGLEQNSDKIIESYYQNTVSLRRNIVLKNLKSPFMYNPSLRNMVMKSGLLSMDISPT